MNIEKELKISCILNDGYYSDLKKMRELVLKFKNEGKETIIIEDEVEENDESFIKVLAYIKYANLKIKLVMDGTKLVSNKDLLKYVDIVELRLDAIDPNILRELNGRDDTFVKNIKNYNYIVRNCPELNIEINTYLNRLNLIDIVNLATSIENMAVDKWNIYRVEGNDKYQMTEEEYNVIIKCLVETNTSSKIISGDSLNSSIVVKSTFPKVNCMLLRACF